MPTQASLCWFGQICAQGASSAAQTGFFPHFNSEQIPNFIILKEQNFCRKYFITFKPGTSMGKHQGLVMYVVRKSTANWLSFDKVKYLFSFLLLENLWGNKPQSQGVF